VDAHAGQLVRVALNLRGSDARGDETSFEELFTADDVLAECGKTFEDSEQAVTWQLVCNYLDLLCADPVVTMAASLNGKYVLKLGELSSAIKQLVLEAVVREKVGEAGSRLYRILLRQHAHGGCSSRGQQKLELKQLAEMALLPERDARPLLMTLLQAELVMLQEVPRTADRNPKTTFYLWHVSLPHAYRVLEAEMLRTLDQLHTRLSHETKVSTTSGLLEAMEAGDMMREECHQEQMVAKCRVDYLEATILKLHQTVMLLRVV